jgi:hypothetical protein
MRESTGHGSQRSGPDEMRGGAEAVCDAERTAAGPNSPAMRAAALSFVLRHGQDDVFAVDGVRCIRHACPFA